MKLGLDDFFAQAPVFKCETFAGCKRYRLDDPRFNALARWYQKWAKRQRDGGDKGLTKILADEILQAHCFAKDAGGVLRVYEHGAYRSRGAALIARSVKRLLEQNADTKSWSTHRAGEVAAYLAVDAPTLWERPPLDTLNLPNGLLNLDSRTLTPHSPGHLSPIQLPLTFDPAARCPEWEAFIGDVFPEDCRTLAFEIIAWLLCPDTSIQRAFLLRGDGQNGKSTYLSAVTAALGVDNVAGLSLQKLESDRFAVARLLGKLANICPDLPSDHLVSTSVFKAIVGGDRLLGEYKYGQSFEFLPFVRLLFSANHFPQSKDSSYAFFRRWEVIPFDRIITREQRLAKPDILARLTSPMELSGLLNRCLAVLPALRSRGGFAQTETTTAARLEFQEHTDPLAVWIDRHTELDVSGIVTKKDLFLSYSSASAEAGRPVAPAKTFYAAVKQLRPTLEEAQRRVNGNPRDVFIGLRFRDRTSEPVTTVAPVTPFLDKSDTLGTESKDESVTAVSSVTSSSLPSELWTEEKEEGGRGRGVGDEVTPLTPLTPCFACQGTHYWISIHGAEVCGTCHPPSSPSLVAEWVDALQPGTSGKPLTQGKTA
jgi:P4 family phage/plasmid primase-like protien